MFRKIVTLLVFAALMQVMFFALVSDAVNSPILAQQDEYSFVKKWGSEGIRNSYMQ
jgi:hypothetical protein